MFEILHKPFLKFILLAAMILLDNNFSSILVAIEMGRLVFDNVKKVVLYIMPVSYRFS